MSDLLARGENAALRRLTAADVGERYLSWMLDPEVTRYLESRWETHTLESLREWVARHDRRDTLLLAILRADSGEHVGNLKIGPFHPHHGTADLGLMIGDRASHGRGIGSEAIALATSTAGRLLSPRKLTASCYSGNLAAARAFNRAGWAAEGRRPAQFVDDDGVVNDQMMFGWLF